MLHLHHQALAEGPGDLFHRAGGCHIEDWRIFILFGKSCRRLLSRCYCLLGQIADTAEALCHRVIQLIALHLMEDLDGQLKNLDLLIQLGRIRITPGEHNRFLLSLIHSKEKQ